MKGLSNMATTYDIVSLDADENVTATVKGGSKKNDAVSKALELRNDERVRVQVVTNKGTVVADFKAPKRIKMSPKYTRTVALPEGVEAPEGFTVRYVRPRKDLALLDSGRGDYALLQLSTGELLDGTPSTTREAGERMTAGV